MKFRLILLAILILPAIAIAHGEGHNITCGTPDKIEMLEKFNSGLLGGIDRNEFLRPLVSGGEAYSESGRFVAYYDTMGPNAPDMADKNSNGYPDYVDSVLYYFEFAWQKEVVELGYRDPIEFDESKGQYIPYEIYLWDTGSGDTASVQDRAFHRGGLYGETTPIYERRREPSPGLYQYRSFIVIDNDFSPKDSITDINSFRKTRPAFPATSGYEALKITAVHEFHHAVQFWYGIIYPSAMAAEMTSVSMEMLLFPEIKDYLQYVNIIFSAPDSYRFGEDSPVAGYGWAIFVEYLRSRFGERPIKRMWELAEDNFNSYAALELALQNEGSSFEECWCEFLDWCYFTGERSIDGMYLKDAALMPEIEFYREEYFDPPLYSSEDKINPAENRAHRVVFRGNAEVSDDTLDLMIGNHDIASAAGQVGAFRNYAILAAKEEQAGLNRLDTSDIFYLLEYDDKFLCSKYYSYQGNKLNKIDYAYPNPVNLNSDTEIYFPAPKTAVIYDKAVVTVFNAELIPIETIKGEFFTNSGNLVISWNYNSGGLPPGVYFYRLEHNNEKTLGKFVVVKK